MKFASSVKNWGLDGVKKSGTVTSGFLEDT